MEEREEMKTEEKIAVDYALKELLKKMVDESTNINDLQKDILKVLAEAIHEEDKKKFIKNANVN